MSTIDLDALEDAVAQQMALFGQPAAYGGRTAAELIAKYGEPGPSMPVQLCNGMGVDTAAIITEMIENPDARVLLVTDEDGTERLVRVDLADVTIVTAMTGDEYDETRAAMEDHLLELIRRAGIVRTVRTGSRRSVLAAMRRWERGGRLEPGITPRLWMVTAWPTYPTGERFLVAAPAGVKDKQQAGFADLWASTMSSNGGESA